MDWKNAELQADSSIKIPERWLHLYYYEALNILFRFENSLRLFVYVILKKQLIEKWDEAAVSPSSTIRTETKKRIIQAKEHGYLGYDVTSPMLYLNSGELTQIITSDAYWKFFAPYFKATKAIVLTKLQEIGTVRNSLAHFRPLKLDDIDLIKQNSKHVLLEIEDCLIQITSISNVVPTNSEEEWYKELKSIRNETLSTSLFISRNREWVRVELSYQVPTLVKNQYGDRYFSYRIGTIRTSQILAKFQEIKNKCIYISEQRPFGTLDASYDISAEKKISIVFSKESIEKNFKNIVNELNDFATSIETETNLLKSDHLAMGDFIESKNATATYRETPGLQSFWNVDVESLSTSPTAIDGVEFWGQRYHYAEDFVSATSHYPWMPSSVSKPSGFL